MGGRSVGATAERHKSAVTGDLRFTVGEGPWHAALRAAMSGRAERVITITDTSADSGRATDPGGRER